MMIGQPMLLLTSGTDVLRLSTGAAIPLDVNASFMDHRGTVVTPGRQNTTVTSQGDINVVAAPAAGTQRSVKTLHVRNVDPANPVLVAVQHSDGTNVAELRKVTLLAGERLSYMEGVGFRVFDSNGAIK